jgi:hypothetical protein
MTSTTHILCQVARILRSADQGVRKERFSLLDAAKLADSPGNLGMKRYIYDAAHRCHQAEAYINKAAAILLKKLKRINDHKEGGKKCEG